MNQRLDFESLLRPKTGWTLDRVVASSYQLDAKTLLPLAMAVRRWGPTGSDISTAEPPDPQELERALRRVHAYCHRCRLNVPLRSSRILRFVEESITEILQPSPFLHLHAKCLILRYERAGAEPTYRLIVLSRNLMMERNWYVMLCCESIQEGTTTESGSAMADFLEYLVAKGDFGGSREFLAGLRCSRFLPPSPYCSLQVFPFGFEKRYNPLANLEFDDLLIAVPLVSSQLLDQVSRSVRGERLLFSRLTTLAKIAPEVRRHFRCYGLVQAAHTAEETGVYGDERKPQGFHMKLYIGRQRGKTVVLLGSANLTTGAVSRNIELMVELVTGDTSLFESVRRHLLGTEVDGEFFVPYSTTFPTGVSPGPVNALRILEHQLVDPDSTSIHAIASSGGRAGRANVTVTVDLSGVSWPEELEVYAWLESDSTDPVLLAPGRRNQLRYRTIPLSRVGGYVAFEIRAPEIETGRFMTRVPFCPLGRWRLDAAQDSLRRERAGTKSGCIEFDELAMACRQVGMTPRWAV